MIKTNLSWPAWREIALFLQPQDLFALSLTCKDLNNLLMDDRPFVHTYCLNQEKKQKCWVYERWLSSLFLDQHLAPNEKQKRPGTLIKMFMEEIVEINALLAEISKADAEFDDPYRPCNSTDAEEDGPEYDQKFEFGPKFPGFFRHPWIAEKFGGWDPDVCFTRDTPLTKK